MEILVLVLTAAVLLILGVPIGISMAFGMLILSLQYQVVPITFIAQNMYSGLESLTLIAIPAFILAGAVMETGGLSKRIVNVAQKLVGNITGGLGMALIIACLFFGAISGSGPATTAAMGSIMIPYMVQTGYDRTYSTSLSAVAGGLGIIVPPSIPLVVYGVATNTSIGDLFLAGIGPALIVALGLILVNYVLSRKHGYQTKGDGETFSWRELGAAVWDAKWALLMPVIILGGIYGGVFTPTEAAVVAIVYGIIIGLFVYKELTVKALWDMILGNTSFVGGMMLTFAPAAALGAVLSLLGVTTGLANLLFTISSNKIVILLLVNVFLLFVGMVLDTTSANIIFSPILLAALSAYGINPVHFGIIMTVNLAIGFVTPPIASNLFVASTLTGISIGKIAKKAVPFIIAMFMALLIITYLPAASVGLVSLLRG